MSAAAPQPEIPRQGPVREVDVLPRLVAGLGRAEWSGQVAVRSGDVERRLYLMDGHVQTMTSNDPAESLTSWLIARGLVDATAVEQAASHVGSSDRGLAFGRKLVELGLLSEAGLAEAELERVIALVETVLSLRSGIYRCEIGAPPSDMISHALDVPRLVATAVLGRWEATWAMNVLGGMGVVLKLNTERLPEHEATGADEAYDLTLLRVDGRSPLGTVLERCPLPELAAVRFLAACHLLGIVDACEPQAAVPTRPAVPAPREAADPETVVESPAETVPVEDPTAARPDRTEVGDATAPGFYRPPVAAPAPRAPEPLMKGEETRSGAGRWLLIALLLALLATVVWFGWVGLAEMSGAGGPRPSTGEAAP